MTKDDIAAVLKQLRLKSGYTQREAAELLGKKQQTVASWETGQSQPDANTLFFICSIYGTTVDEAFGFTHDRKNISSKDIELLEKYHALDALGQSHVDAVLSWESDRVKALADAVAEIASLKGRLETCSSLVSIEDMRPKYYITYYHKLASAGRGEYLFEDIPTSLTGCLVKYIICQLHHFVKLQKPPGIGVPNGFHIDFLLPDRSRRHNLLHT